MINTQRRNNVRVLFIAFVMMCFVCTAVIMKGKISPHQANVLLVCLLCVFLLLVFYAAWIDRQQAKKVRACVNFFEEKVNERNKIDDEKQGD